MQRHAPVRPIWICAACAYPWPCEQARAELTAEYADDPKLLAIDMAQCLAEANADLSRICPEQPPDGVETYARFLGWVRHLRINQHRNGGHFQQ
ncbi:flavin reductase [Micromonospora globbae]|uniref:flavin reductase n=1 Tax=Micromonospora globbae TaxID=1894969 RepID=UPI00386E18C3|nr:flavin reductase [Micromonospora globbae]